jgi:hypothetical protein
MKNSIPFFILFFAMLSFFLVACGNEGEKTAETSSESTSSKEVTPEVVFENAYAKVVRVSLAPGESLASHEGEARVIYSLSDYSIDWVEQGKSEGTKSWKKGDVHVHEAGQHAAKNIGQSTAEWLAFVKGKAELPDCSDNTVENDVHTVAPDFADQRFDNEAFRITEVSLPPGESIPMHSGINRVIYSLSDYRIRYESNKEGTGDKSFQRGDAHWHEACMHALENTGQGDARFLVVAYKRANE